MASLLLSQSHCPYHKLTHINVIACKCSMTAESVPPISCDSMSASHQLCFLFLLLAVGRRAGLWTVIPCQLIVMIGLDIVYCVTAGRSMRFLYQHTCNGWREHTCTSFGLSAWIVIFAIIQIFLSMVSPYTGPVLFMCLYAMLLSRIDRNVQLHFHAHSLAC